MMKKKSLLVIFSIILISFVVATVLLIRLRQLNQLETSLFSCVNFPIECTEINKSVQATNLSDAIFSYLAEDMGYVGLKPETYQATANPNFQPPYLLGSGLVGGDARNGYFPLICPVGRCFPDHDSVVLVDLDPIIHLWSIERTSSTLSTDGWIITGREVQELVIVPGAGEVVYNSGLAENPILLDSARQNEDYILWKKSLNYEIVCTIGKCTKSYRHDPSLDD